MSMPEGLSQRSPSTAFQAFAFEDQQVRTYIGADGEPTFAGRDVCAALHIANTRAALARLALDEKGVVTADTLGGEQQIATVTEAGLYRLVFTSRRPEAEAFRQWVTRDVLPSIRRTGAYSTVSAAPSRELTRMELLQLGIEAERERLAAIGERDVARAELAAAAPMVVKAQAHSAGHRAVTRQEFAREVIVATSGMTEAPVTHRQVFALLGSMGLFVGGQRSDTGHATTDAIRRGLALTEKGVAPNGHEYATGKLTPAGQDHAWRRITRDLGLGGLDRHQGVLVAGGAL